jgi:EAL domain-containing protein (putative c-di-GMP-specific phosphodiesterase class I)
MTPTPRESPVDDAAVADLSRAIDAGEVQPWYQPIVRLTTGELVGFESLARWHRPSGVVELPGAFIDLAEETGLITRLDLAVLDRAAAALARWREQRPDLRLSVNFSGRHLDEDGWVDSLHALASGQGVPPANLDVELTESARPRDLARGAALLAGLRELGYAVWFDDFGTGWSELTHLVDVPVDGIKIDRFFTERLGGRADAVVRALLQVADDLGLATTIEGISTREQADRARDLGCDLAQGYLWSPPLSEADAGELVAAADPVLRT